MSNTGNMTGKLKTGRRTPGLSVFEAILLLIVKIEAIPIPVIMVTKKKSRAPSPRLPCIVVNTTKANKVKASIKIQDEISRAPRYCAGVHI